MLGGRRRYLTRCPIDAICASLPAGDGHSPSGRKTGRLVVDVREHDEVLPQRQLQKAGPSHAASAWLCLGRVLMYTSDTKCIGDQRQ
jgi:hypothetical protein